MSFIGHSQDTIDYNEIDIILPGKISSTRMYFYKDKPFTGVMTYPYGSSHFSQTISIYKGKTHGEFRQYHNNGELKEITNYEYGKRDGLSLRWYDNGQLESKIYYEQGHLLDTSYRWHRNGVLKSWDIEKPGKSYTLEVHMYYENGQKRCEITQEIQKRWHRNGQLSFIGGIVNNKSHGKLKYYNEDGKLIKTEVYRHGKKLKEKQRRNEPTS